MNLPPNGWVGSGFTFANVIYYGIVWLDLTTTLDPTSGLTLLMDVTNCPYGWDCWTIS